MGFWFDLDFVKACGDGGGLWVVVWGGCCGGRERERVKWIKKWIDVKDKRCDIEWIVKWYTKFNKIVFWRVKC